MEDESGGPLEDTSFRKVPTVVYTTQDEARILKIVAEAKKRDLTHPFFGQTSFFQTVPLGEKIPS